MKKFLSLFLIVVLISILMFNPTTICAENSVEISAESAVLIEGSTGHIIYEKDKDSRRAPASITKIMTLLLIFEAIENGQFTLEDSVSVSEHAASMGGSQVYLEPYETQTVNDMIKCISIASANDAATAMAEFIAGSEEAFVNKMNEKAKELGMDNTNFVNCCGLDVDNHYSTAYDVALMSRELITKYPQISNYSTVWMDKITHVTKKGTSEFGLTNTNKLVRTYDGITGLKTGSTSIAKYCLSATAKRDEMDLIAVVMTAPDYKVRFTEAAKLLDYGFANCSLFSDDNSDLQLEPLKISKGVKDTISICINDKFTYLCSNGISKSDIQKEPIFSENIVAPINQGDKLGEVIYKIGDKAIGNVSIVASETVAKAKYINYLKNAFYDYFLF